MDVASAARCGNFIRGNCHIVGPGHAAAVTPPKILCTPQTNLLILTSKQAHVENLVAIGS
jgi:hypothetical protein